MKNFLRSWFRLRTGPAVAQGGGGTDLWQYAALVAGIFVQPFLAKFQATGAWNLQGWLGWLVFSLIVGIVIFPLVYRNAFDPNKSIWVQLAAIFAAGMGWQALFEAAGKAVGSATGTNLIGS